MIVCDKCFGTGTFEFHGDNRPCWNCNKTGYLKGVFLSLEDAQIILSDGIVKSQLGSALISKIEKQLH